MKKLLSIILAISILLMVSVVGASAILESTGEYTPSEGVKTNRYYVYMPREWCNEYTDSIGVYWWEGTDACSSFYDSEGEVDWPGYKANAGEEENIFYVDCPKDVSVMLWNNYIDRDEELSKTAMKSVDILCEFYSEGDSDVYDGTFFNNMEESFYGDKSALGEYADNFFFSDYGISFNMNNMIYIMDSSKVKIDSLTGTSVCDGEWYFYYGNREYGNYPLKEDAEKYGEIGSIDLYEPNAPIEPDTTIPVTEPTNEFNTTPSRENVVYFDVKSSGWNNFSELYCHIWMPFAPKESHSWQSKAELCDYDSSTGIASYDLSKFVFQIRPDDEKYYCVIFSTNTGEQTHSTIMSGACIGDTMYCTGEMVENYLDFNKKSSLAFWRNNPDCEPKKEITSMGNIVGTGYTEWDSDETLLADFLIMYYNDKEKTDLTQQIVNKLNVNPSDVLDEVRGKLFTDIPDINKYKQIESILLSIKDPVQELDYDINGDGSVNVNDVTMIQKFAVELEAFDETQMRMADVNKDETVNVIDATMLQKLLVGDL